MKIEALRKLAGREEIDYQFFISALSDYSRPRDKISEWIKSGDLVRVKKGLYVFGKDTAHEPYSKELLANLIYGPSAISMSYAMSYHGLIPETVTIITSITNNRKKEFVTPVGNFTYHYLNSKKYTTGVLQIEQATNQFILMASPEKALCDHIHLVDRYILLTCTKDVENYLFYDLRINQSELTKFSIERLDELCLNYNDKRLIQLKEFIKAIK